MDRQVTELTENDVIDAVCSALRTRGWTIVSRASTTERGVDIIARGPNCETLHVEAKGAMSSKPGPARHGQRFSASQVRTHVDRAFFRAAAALGSGSSLNRYAIALPATEPHRQLVERIRGALDDLAIGVFWVEAHGVVRLEATWEL